MESNERYSDKLAKYILLAAGIGIIGTICWYFRNVIIYMLVAVVVSLISKPIMKLLQKITVKGRAVKPSGAKAPYTKRSSPPSSPHAPAVARSVRFTMASSRNGAASISSRRVPQVAQPSVQLVSREC
jgi:hypothetical protein